MKRVALFFFAVISVAAIATFVTLHWSESRISRVDEVAAHQWLHRELQLTDAQHKALEPIEAKFMEKQHTLAGQLQVENVNLARLMTEDKAYTPRVATQVERVHHCMGELQKASIEHLFEMRTVLTPEQGDKLLVLAQHALEQSP